MGYSKWIISKKNLVFNFLFSQSVYSTKAFVFVTKIACASYENAMLQKGRPLRPFAIPRNKPVTH